QEMTTGSGIAFDPLGSKELRGVPGDWRVFAVPDSDGRGPLPVLEPPPPREPQAGPRRRWLLIGGAGVVVIGAIVAVLLALGGGGMSPATRPTPAATAARFVGALALVVKTV